jgi:hypothetical protein
MQTKMTTDDLYFAILYWAALYNHHKLLGFPEYVDAMHRDNACGMAYQVIKDNYIVQDCCLVEQVWN